MEEFNNAAFYKKAIQKGGKTLSYIKVKNAISGISLSTNDKEKKILISVLEEIYEQAKKNIVKS